MILKLFPVSWIVLFMFNYNLYCFIKVPYAVSPIVNHQCHDCYEMSKIKITLSNWCYIIMACHKSLFCIIHLIHFHLGHIFWKVISLVIVSVDMICVHLSFSRC